MSGGYVATGSRIRSDLHLTVDDLHATLVADGQRLIVSTESAARLLARAVDSVQQATGRPAPLRQTLGRVARMLDEAGLSAQVTAPRGTVIEVGRDCDSRSGRLLLGSRHTRFGAPRVLLPAVSGYAWASSRIRRRIGYASAGVVIATLLGGAGLRRAIADRAGS